MKSCNAMCTAGEEQSRFTLCLIFCLRCAALSHRGAWRQHSSTCNLDKIPSKSRAVYFSETLSVRILLTDGLKPRIVHTFCLAQFCLLKQCRGGEVKTQHHALAQAEGCCQKWNEKALTRRAGSQDACQRGLRCVVHRSPSASDSRMR